MASSNDGPRISPTGKCSHNHNACQLLVSVVSVAAPRFRRFRQYTSGNHVPPGLEVCQAATITQNLILLSSHFFPNRSSTFIIMVCILIGQVSAIGWLGICISRLLSDTVYMCAR
jgi:hypothetical protein